MARPNGPLVLLLLDSVYGTFGFPREKRSLRFTGTLGKQPLKLMVVDPILKHRSYYRSSAGFTFSSGGSFL